MDSETRDASIPFVDAASVEGEVSLDEATSSGLCPDKSRGRVEVVGTEGQIGPESTSRFGYSFVPLKTGIFKFSLVITSRCQQNGKTVCCRHRPSLFKAFAPGKGCNVARHSANCVPHAVSETAQHLRKTVSTGVAEQQTEVSVAGHACTPFVQVVDCQSIRRVVSKATLWEDLQLAQLNRWGTLMSRSTSPA